MSISASVNVTVTILQKAGFIRYSRGKIAICDRAGMENSVSVVRGLTLEGYCSRIDEVTLEV